MGMSSVRCWRLRLDAKEHEETPPKASLDGSPIATARVDAYHAGPEVVKDGKSTKLQGERRVQRISEKELECYTIRSYSFLVQRERDTHKA
jgi:hypothetical protein